MIGIDNEWSISFFVATLIYASLIWFGKAHLSEKSKDEMALWLLGAYNDTWQKHYGAFFDAVFGVRHFTLKCFTRSCIASIFSAFAIYFLLLNAEGSFGGRIQEQVSLIDVLVLAVKINLIPDYLSLYETRFLIKVFQKYRSIKVQAALLLLDLLASGLIIYAFISGYRLTNGQPPISLAEMVGFFSFYSVFFYSTFLTSFWAWLFVLASATLRLVRTLKLERFVNVWGNAPAQISLLISVYAFFVMLFVAPATQRDAELRTTAFDQWLCDIAPSSACPHVLRLSNDQQLKLKIQIRLCSNGSGDDCFNSAESFRREEEFDRAFELYNSGCQVNNAASCMLAASLLEKVNLDNAPDRRAYAAKACSLDNGDGCALAGVIAYRAADYSSDEAAAFAMFDKGCKLLSQHACVSLAWMTEQGRSVAPDADFARLVYRQACDAQNGLGCYLLGQQLEYGRAGPPNLSLALARYTEACTLGEQRGCKEKENIELGGWQLSEARNFRSPWEVCSAEPSGGCFLSGKELLTGQASRSNPVLAAKYFDIACKLGDPKGCIWFGRSLQLGRGVPESRRAAVQAFDAGCELGSQEACLESLIMATSDPQYFLTETAEAHLRYLIALCESGDTDGCNALEPFEGNQLLSLEAYFSDTTCRAKGYENCEHFFSAQVKPNLP